jgi:hypothetical protein
VFGVEPAARGDKINERRGQAGHHGHARRRRQITAREQRFANGRPFPEAFENAIERELGNLSLVILREHQTSLVGADLGQSRRDRALQAGTARDGYLDLLVSGSDRIDQIGIDKERRERQHRRCDLRLIGRQRHHHRRRRARARR